MRSSHFWSALLQLTGSKKTSRPLQGHVSPQPGPLPPPSRRHAARRRRFHPRSKRLSVHHAHRGENTRNTHLPPFLPKPNKHHPPSQPTTRAGRSTPSTKPPTTPPGAPASKNAPPVSRAVTTPSTFIFSIDVLSGVTAGFLSERFF